MPQAFLAPLRFARQGGEQGAMNSSSEAAGPAAAEQGCDVGKPQQPAFRPGDGGFQQACRSPAATRTGQQCPWRWKQEILAAFIVGSGQIAPAPFQRRWRVDLQPPGRENCDPLLQRVVVLQAGAGCGDSNLVSGSQRSWPLIRGTRQAHPNPLDSTKPPSSSAPIWT